MTYRIKLLLPFVLALLLAGCSDRKTAPADFYRDSPAPAVLRDLPPQVRVFIEQKEQFALALAKKLGVEPDRPTLEYFRHAKRGEYRAASRIYQELRERGGKLESPKHVGLLLPLWDPLLEVQLALDAYAAGAGKFATSYGEGIVHSIPRGSIYFGGTDPGRGLPAAFFKPSGGDDALFMVSQNQLADGQYFNYLRAAFGGKIYTPSNEDSQQAFNDYLSDARKRLEHDPKSPNEPRQIRPGEDVKMVEGRVQVSGQVAVMAINALTAKVIFDKNPEREFYVEESFPLDWMYPHLTPHGLIMKINRQPLDSLPPEVVAKDHEFWSRKQNEFIGGWLTPETSVKELCDFVEKVHLRKDLAGFKGDPEFVCNYYACAAYSKLRSSQGGLYAWRITHSKSPDEQQGMIKEADFAFRQSFAFDPTSPEALFRYVNLLVQLGRVDDSLLIARTAGKLRPSDGQIKNLTTELERIQKSTAKQTPTAP